MMAYKGILMSQFFVGWKDGSKKQMGFFLLGKYSGKYSGTCVWPSKFFLYASCGANQMLGM